MKACIGAGLSAIKAANEASCGLVVPLPLLLLLQLLLLRLLVSGCCRRRCRRFRIFAPSARLLETVYRARFQLIGERELALLARLHGNREKPLRLSPQRLL